MAELNFDSRLNYQKIAQEGSFGVSVADPNFDVTTTINHALGYIPVCKVWFTNASSEICPASSSSFSLINAAFDNRACYFTITTSSLRIVFDRNVTSGATINSTIYYRIYENVVI